jgi:hypothetical protein
MIFGCIQDPFCPRSAAKEREEDLTTDVIVIGANVLQRGEASD